MTNQEKLNRYTDALTDFFNKTGSFREGLQMLWSKVRNDTLEEAAQLFPEEDAARIRALKIEPPKAAGASAGGTK
jgi:hypothetical protein